MESTNSNIFEVAIIGGGAAGVMATIRAVLNNDQTILFPGTAKDKKRSRAFWVTKVENMPGHLNYKKAIEEPNKQSLEWLSHGPFKNKFHWKKNTGIINILKRPDGIFEMEASDHQTYLAKYVVLCTGVMDVQPEIKGSIQPILPYANIQDVDYCLRCDGHHVIGKNLGVIGHESSAAWVAVMLYERYLSEMDKKVYVFTNGKKANFDKDVEELLRIYDIEVCESHLTSIIGDNHLKALEFEDGQKVSVEILFVSLGMIVYNQLAKQLGANLDPRGFVIGSEEGQTNIDGLYVAGDLKANTKKQIYTSWDTAVNSLDHINMRLRKEKRNKLKERASDTRI